MKRICLKTIVLSLSLMAIACQGGSRKGHLSTFDQPFSEARQNIQEDAGKTSDTKNADAQDEKPGYRQGLEIPVGKADVPSMLLYREGYTASYNAEIRTPNWVAWHLTDAHTNGSAKRNGIGFHPDEDVPEPRADTYDYMQSGYDRGHMCPAGDNHWSLPAMEQSFLMTNVCPQNHALNSGLWNTIEKQCRTWAEKYGDVYIVCGPVYFNQKHKTIGKNKVQVPEAFFKVVLCLEDEPKAIGFICRNQSAKGRRKSDYVNSVDEVERITGMDFFPQLPDDIEQRIERRADISEW